MKQARRKKLRRFLKSFLSILLCCFLITSYSYKKPVKADAAMTAVTITGGLVIAGVVTALGIGVAASMGHPEYAQACQNIWNRISENTRMQIALTGLNVSNGLAKVVLTQQFLREAFDSIKAEFPGAASVIAGAFTYDQFMNLTGLPANIAAYVYGSYGMSASFTDLKYSFNFFVPSFADNATVTMAMPVTGLVMKSSGSYHDAFIDLSGQTLSVFDWSISGSRLFNSFCKLSSGYWMNNYNYWSNQSKLVFPVGSTWVMYTAIHDGVTYLFMTSKDIGAGITYLCTIDGDPGTIPIFGQDLFNPVIDSLFAEGDSVMVNPVDDVIGDVAGRVGNPDGTIPISVPVSGDVAGDRDIADQQTRTQSDTLGRDIATDADKTADTDYNDTNDKDTTLPRSSSMPSMLLPTGLAKKFPFCLPWDLAACYRLFQVTPKAPVWIIPIDIDQGALHLHKTYTYDLNGNNVMDTCLPVFKWFLNIGFIIALVVLTKKIMS